jgi:RNA polymerase sigma factor (sigma-70 family)
MSDSTSDTTFLLGKMDLINQHARNDLITHACRKLHHLTSRMLKSFPGVRRWEQTDDVLNSSLIRLNKALSSEVPQTSHHFWHLATVMIRRELIDMARHYQGPQGYGANHHTDGAGKAADDTGGPLHAQQVDADEPVSMEQWQLYHEESAKLPDKERAVHDLIYYQGRSQAEAATILNVSLRTVKRRWQSARISLSKSLGK